MAAEPTTNGGSSAIPAGMTAAERLREKHEAVAAHRAMVEDTVDEDDVEHPPPSTLAVSDTPSAPVSVPAAEALSEIAAGKQKAQAEPVSGQKTSKDPAALHTRFEESFPALGGGPKASAPSPTAMAWGSKKPSSVHTGMKNGINGHVPVLVPGNLPSRTSAPALNPTTTNGPINSQRRDMSSPQHMMIPGKTSERIQFAPSQLLPRTQLKKPIPEVIRSINKSSKAKIEMKTGPNGVIVFEGSGPVDAARQALKDLAKVVGSKQQVKVPIPMSVRPFVIGRQGAVIQAISKRTGARVQVPKTEETQASGVEDDDSTTIDVSIEGDAVAAEMARREIESIVNERTSTVNLRLRDVPSEFFPFIAGPHNSRISALENARQVKVQIPHYHTWSNQPPPQPPPSGNLPQFIPSAGGNIKISGDRLAAQETRAEIERQVRELRQQITLSQVPIDRGRHQFILENESSFHDLLNETGCAVILPPDSENTELLTVTGPHDRIESGLEKIIDLAAAMQSSRIDIARQHANAPMGSQAHARALTRYLQQRRAIQQLEKQHSTRIVLPTADQGSPDWELYFKEGRNGIRAKQDIMNLINAYPPTRLRHVDLDPFFHQHVHQQGARRVRDDYGVHLVVPERDDPMQQMILVYEGPTSGSAEEYQLPKQQPSPQEIAQFEGNLRQAQEHLLSLVQGQRDIGTAKIAVPPKYHEKVRKFVLREQQNLPSSQIPVQIIFAAAGTANGGVSVAPDQECLLRGPSKAIEDLAGKIMAFVEAEKRDELERGHVTSFDFPQKYANFLIGKRGENINKYREEHDVDIQVKDGKVDITGPKAKAEIAKSKILALAKKLEDESTHILKINPRYHREIIGAKGSQVNRLQDRYNVRVQFPRSSPAVGDDRSVADDASEAGGARVRRPNQGPDEVIVKGPSKGADAARDELLSLLQYTIDNSHISTVSVAQRQLPSLIGQGGQEMESIRLATGAQIDVPPRDSAEPSGRVQIQLKGTKKAVEEARKTLEQRAKIFDDTVTRTVDVDRKYHKALIGSGGANIRNIVVGAGGSDDRRDLARTVRFPRQDSTDNVIRVEGSKVLVDSIVAAIEAFANQREGQTTEIIEVAPGKHRLLIGRGGDIRRALESQFNVGLDIPKMSEQGSARSQVKVTGQPADVQKAKDHILELTKDLEGETFLMPRKYHHLVSDNGQFFRRLRNDHKVSVDHAGHKLPARPTAAAHAQSNGESKLPLITDDPDSHRWEIVNGSESTEEGEIPWILRGSPDSIAKARTILENAVENAKTQQSQSIGYLMLPDPKTHRFIIGQGGAQINSIRKQTDCKINVPRDQSQGSAIEIVGSKEGVEHAKDVILDVVQNGGRRD